MPSLSPTRRFLRSGLVDLMVGPHGVDRYLELIRPEITVRDARARVVGVRHQTERSVTLTLRPNAAWSGFTAGQFIRVGVEIDGVRRTRTYSPACSEHSPNGLLELTVTTHPNGLVSQYLRRRTRAGTILHLSEAQGGFVLPQPRPRRLALIGGGSGITPVLSMLRTLIDENHDGEIAFVHYARTAADWLHAAEVRELAARHRNLSVEYVATRQGGAHLSARSIQRLIGSLGDVQAAVCGPPSLIAAVRGIWPASEPVLSESFTPPTLQTAAATSGTLSFVRSGRSVPIGSGTLLEQAEAAGLTPEFGCRMGICHTCTCRKAAGAVRNVRTGEVLDEEDEDIQLCVSVPAGDVALEI
ncbi:MAG TPA: ferredoxin reductase [Solirubrobacteraceae bacterium]